MSTLRLFLRIATLAGVFAATGTAYAATTCHASWYGPGFHGNTMANGKRFDMHDPTTVAHKSYRFGTRLRIKNIKNGRIITAVVRDRGPYIAGRCLDLSRAGAAKLGFLNAGSARVIVTVLQ